MTSPQTVDDNTPSAPDSGGQNGDAPKAGKAGRGGGRRGGRQRGDGGKRSAARLAAVQALYQIEFSGESPETIILEFLQHRVEADLGEGLKLNADRDFFTDLVRGVTREADRIDPMVAGALAEGWTLERVQPTLRAILRTGTYELLSHVEVPVPVIINEYVNVAHAFYSGAEPGFVNGVLDRLARLLRVGEGGAPR